MPPTAWRDPNERDYELPPGPPHTPPPAPPRRQAPKRPPRAPRSWPEFFLRTLTILIALALLTRVAALLAGR